MNITPRKQQVLFWISWTLILLLDFIPGYRRYYTMDPPTGDHVLGPLRRHWAWHRRGLWGIGLVNRLGLLGGFVAECERRVRQRKPSSGS